LKIDIENPECFPEWVETMPADVGWNMEVPIAPKDMKRSRIRKFGAIPTREIKMMAKSGPPRTKKRVRKRSAKYPTHGCIIKAKRPLVAAIKPT
jgi:hypothetical protein